MNIKYIVTFSFKDSQIRTASLKLTLMTDFVLTMLFSLTIFLIKTVGEETFIKDILGKSYSYFLLNIYSFFFF